MFQITLAFSLLLATGQAVGDGGSRLNEYMVSYMNGVINPVKNIESHLRIGGADQKRGFHYYRRHLLFEFPWLKSMIVAPKMLHLLTCMSAVF